MKCRKCYSNAHTHPLLPPFEMTKPWLTFPSSIGCLILSLDWAFDPKWLDAEKPSSCHHVTLAVTWDMHAGGFTSGRCVVVLCAQNVCVFFCFCFFFLTRLARWGHTNTCPTESFHLTESDPAKLDVQSINSSSSNNVPACIYSSQRTANTSMCCLMVVTGMISKRLNKSIYRCTCKKI